MLLDKFEWVGLVLIVQHDELVGSCLIVNIINSVLESIYKWFDRFAFNLFLITIHVPLRNSVK